LARIVFAVGIVLKPRQRQQTETAGDEIEAEQHDQDQSHGEDQCTDQGLIGLHRPGDGKAGRCRKDAASKAATDDKIDGG
jgi:hypothetical protein